MRASLSRIRAVIKITVVLGFFASALAEEPYFPISTKAGEPGISEFQAKWYGESLKRMGEPRLPAAAKDPSAVIYRLTILPTRGNPIAVRVQKHDRVYSLAARRLSGEGGHDPGKLVEQRDVQLSEDDSAALEMLIAQLQFFSMPADEVPSGLDGDEWIIEGVSGGKHHIVVRWCASSVDTKKRGLTAFVRLCRFLIDRSTLSVRPTNSGAKLI